MKKYALIIKELRYRLHLDQQEFANYIGVSKSAICQYEQGRRVPRMPLVRKFIAESKKCNLCLTVEDFFEDIHKEVNKNIKVERSPINQAKSNKISTLPPENKDTKLRTFRLSVETITTIESLKKELSKAARINLSMATIITMAIHHIKDKSLSDLL